MNIALVVGKHDDLHSQKDIPLKNHLEIILGHTITVKNDNWQNWDPEDFDVIVISESVSSSKTEWLFPTSTDILTVEGANSDELRMGDGGSSKGGNSQNIVVVDPSHPIMQGYSGTVTVTTSTKNLGHMTGWNTNPASQVQVLAYYESSGELKAKILVADKDAILADGISTANGKRIFVAAQYFGNLNSDGKILFNQALAWIAGALYNPPSSIAGVEDDSFTFLEDNANNTLDVLVNDIDVSYIDSVDTIGTFGTVEIVNEGQSLEFTPTSGFYGETSFTYMVYYTGGGYDTAIVTINVDQNSTTTQLEIALICNKSNCNHSNKDVPLKNHLTTLGSVTTYGHKEHSWNPTDYDLVVISESVHSSKTAWLHDEAVPILTVEGANADELAMGDGGSSKGGNNKYIIIAKDHPITAGFTVGQQVQVTTSTNNLGHMTGWDENGSGVELLANYDINGDTKAKILAVDKFGFLVDGTQAPEKRVFFGAQYFANLTPAGETLFDQAFAWVTTP